MQIPGKMKSLHTIYRRANMFKEFIQLNEEIIKVELKELVRNSVEETLNKLLDQEAKELTGAAKI